MVAAATAIHAHDGNLVIDSTVSELGDSGVTLAAGAYRPTAVADEGLAAKRGISLAYLRRLRADRPDLWDANVNGWLHGNDLAGYPSDDRQFLLRLFQPDGNGDGLGVVRAVLSDRYKVIANLDALMATLDGIRQTGVEVVFDGLDLTERRLYARVVAPGIRALAPTLLDGYRSPFGGHLYVPGGTWAPAQAREAAAREGRGHEPGREPVLFAGFVVSHSEVGDGAWSITPRIVAEICGNGLQIIADVTRAVHLGTRQTVRQVAKAAKFSDETADAILGHIIRGGQLTAGGVMQAITSVAQTLDDADAAHDLEAQAIHALNLAAA